MAKSTIFWIILALILYLFLSLTYLNLPGLQYDEVNFVNAALHREDAPFVAWEAKIFGKKVPLMIMRYIGALKSGLYAPVFHIFGTSAAAVRLPVICIGAITLLISYGLFGRMFGRKVGVVALLLFATDPTFIFSNKLDWGPVSLMLLLELSSLYYLWRWMKEGRRSFLAIAGFLLGLGLYNKIIFAWYLAALSVSLLCFFRDSVKQLAQRRQLICLVPAFVLGCLPLIAFNISIPMATFKNNEVFGSFNMGTLRHRYELIRGTLDGGGTYFLFNGTELGTHPLEIQNSAAPGTKDFAIGAVAGTGWVRRSPLPLVLAGSLLFILIAGLMNRLRNRRRVAFIGAQLFVMAGLMCLTADATGAHHVIAFYPFVFAVVAYAVCEMGNWLGRSRPFASGIVVGICLLPVFSAQLIVDARHLHSFQSKGGAGFWSDAIYDLVSFARANPGRKFILMDWGFGNQFSLLSNGHIKYEEFPCERKSLDICIESLLGDPDNLLVFYAPPLGNGPVLNAYRRAADQAHLYPNLRKTFLQRDGTPVYFLYETVRPMLQLKTREFRYRREAEQFDAKEGGSIDVKPAASNKAALGNSWGLHQWDYASYRFDLPETYYAPRLLLRYAFVSPGTQAYHLYIDGEYCETITLESTYGFGETGEQWRTVEKRLDYLPGGRHELKFKPVRNNQRINLDYFELRNPENLK
jgi:4-amino-4-deoxy-L-arabinose transferase-like glycosyltransferase